VRRAKIKNSGDSNAGVDAEKEEHSSIVVGFQTGTTILEISLEVPQKI